MLLLITQIKNWPEPIAYAPMEYFYVFAYFKTIKRMLQLNVNVVIN